MLQLIRYLRREIRCYGAPLSSVIFSENCPKNLPLVRCFESNCPFDLISVYTKAKADSGTEMFFSSKDWQIADQLFFSLGQGDSSEQEILLSLAEESFSLGERELKDTIGKNGKSALVLGCCAGAVLVLLLL
jgi:stage III sporulation protein AB